MFGVREASPKKLVSSLAPPMRARSARVPLVGRDYRRVRVARDYRRVIRAPQREPASAKKGNNQRQKKARQEPRATDVGSQRPRPPVGRDSRRVIRVRPREHRRHGKSSSVASRHRCGLAAPASPGGTRLPASHPSASARAYATREKLVSSLAPPLRAPRAHFAGLAC